MPDDPIVENEEVAEPQDSDAIAGFDEAASETPPDADDEPVKEKGAEEKAEEEVVAKKEPEKKVAEKEAEKKPVEEKPAEEKKEEPEEELTAKERADKRAEALEGAPKETLGEGEEPPSETPPPDADKVRAPSPSRLTKEQVASYLKSVNPDDLPDELVIGNETVNVAEFVKEFPDQSNAVVVLSNMIAEKVIKDKLDSLNLVDSAAIKDLQGQLNLYAWWDEVTMVHSDGKKVAASKEFNTWLDKQRLGIQTMGGPNGSPQDAIDVLDFYKEETAKANVGEHDDAARKKKKGKDDLMKGVLKGKQAIPKTEDQIAEDDAQAGWEEGLKDEND